MKIHFHINDNGSESAPSNHTSYTLEDVGSICIPHPDKEVDLCVIPIGPILNHAAEQKKQLFLIPMDKSLLPSREEVAGLTAIEEVVMIGYPNGLWDSVNNKPIVRRGITATHPHFDYNGKQEFMIDAACFPGSSGSPVLLFNQGNYSTKSGDLVIGTRLKLLGVLYAGPQITAQGDIAVVDVPTQQRPIALSNIPMNLGYVIKAEKLLDFETLLEQLK